LIISIMYKIDIKNEYLICLFMLIYAGSEAINLNWQLIRTQIILKLKPDFFVVYSGLYIIVICYDI
jgi:hypothetical protein